MKCVVLTTDTKHHRYFVNRIARHAVTTVILERRKLNYWKLYWKWVGSRRTPWAFIDNPYIPLAYSAFHRRQDEFEERFFAGGIPADFSGHAALYEFLSVNDSACVERVSAIQPDLIVSFGTGLLKEGILGIEALKVNIHRGILPAYRGLDSDLWAFYCRDFQNVGTTVHKLDASFDTGDILRQARLKIEPDMKVHHIRYHTTVMAADMVESLLRDLQMRSSVGGRSQGHSQGRYYSFIPPLKRMVAIRRFNRYVTSVARRTSPPSTAGCRS